MSDWLYHHLRAEGPPAAVAAFRAAAAGPGLVPWEDDLAPVEEDWFHRMMAQPPGQRRLGLEDTRRLAALLRAALEERRARRATLPPTRVPFDLHALLPLPPDMLRLGPDDPRTLEWRRAHWGTPEGLRGVVELPPARRGRAPRRLPGLLWVGFFSADWSPWMALRRLRLDWPLLRLDMRPLYDGP